MKNQTQLHIHLHIHQQPIELRSDSVVKPPESSMGLNAAATDKFAPGNGRGLPSIATDQPFASLCREVAQCLRSTPLFRRGKSLVTVDESTGEVRLMTPARWGGWHKRFFNFHKGVGDKRRTVDLGQKRVCCMLASEEVRTHVCELHSVNLLRLPTWRGEGADRTIVLLPDGYDDVTKIYTVPTLKYALDWSLEQAHAWFEKQFASFLFAESGNLFDRRSFSAFVSAMLGVFTTNLLPPGAVRPMIVVSSDQPGAGKSVLVHAILSPTYGRIEVYNTATNDEALRRALDNAALADAPYVFFDEVWNLASNELVHFISSPTHMPRVKGRSARAKYMNLCQVFATGRSVELSVDLLRRSIVVFLAAGKRVGGRANVAKISSAVLSSVEYRRSACAALWALLSHWSEIGMPTCREARLPSFEAYASLVGSVCEASGFANPFAAIGDVSKGGDEAKCALESSLSQIAGGFVQSDEVTIDSILDGLRKAGTLDLVLPFTCRDERKALGHKLKELRGRRFTDTRGRQFDFGRRDDVRGSRYTVRFVAG